MLLSETYATPRTEYTMERRDEQEQPHEATGLPHPRDILSRFRPVSGLEKKPSPSHEITVAYDDSRSLTVAGAAQAFNLFPVSPLTYPFESGK